MAAKTMGGKKPATKENKASQSGKPAQAKSAEEKKSAEKKADAKKANGIKISKNMALIGGAVLVVIIIGALFAMQPKAGGGGLVNLTNIYSNETITMNELQGCASQFNEQGIIKQLVQQFYNGTSSKVYMYGMPTEISCNGVNYTYSFELGDGYAKTTINGNFAKSSFKTGIVANNISVPEADTIKGVLIYIQRVGIRNVNENGTNTTTIGLAYRYDLTANSMNTFDKYATLQILEDYGVSQKNMTYVPAVVFNCKNAYVGVMVDNPANGTFQPDAEKLMLEVLSCIFNEGEPSSICAPLGITAQVAPNGSKTVNLSISMPSQYVYKRYVTGMESCKPGDGQTKVDVFYSLNCTECAQQRPLLEQVKNEFGGKLDVTYYCVGKKDECAKFLRV